MFEMVYKAMTVTVTVGAAGNISPETVWMAVLTSKLTRTLWLATPLVIEIEVENVVVSAVTPQGTLTVHAASRAAVVVGVHPPPGPMVAVVKLPAPSFPLIVKEAEGVTRDRV